MGDSQSLRPQSHTEGSWSAGHTGPFPRGLAGSFWTFRAPPQSSHDGAQVCSGLRPTGPWRPKLGLSELPLLPRPPGQRLGLRNAIPAEEAAASVEWAPPRNPSLIAHGPCHPHQLSHRRWGRGPAWDRSEGWGKGQRHKVGGSRANMGGGTQEMRVFKDVEGGGSLFTLTLYLIRSFLMFRPTF